MIYHLISGQLLNYSLKTIKWSTNVPNGLPRYSIFQFLLNIDSVLPGFVQKLIHFSFKWFKIFFRWLLYHLLDFKFTAWGWWNRKEATTVWWTFLATWDKKSQNICLCGENARKFSHWIFPQNFPTVSHWQIVYRFEKNNMITDQTSPKKFLKVGFINKNKMMHGIQKEANDLLILVAFYTFTFLCKYQQVP